MTLVPVSPPRRAPRRPSGGFTLIELMIALAIVGIVAAIAVPNYLESVRRSKIIEATSALGDLRARYEQFFLDNRTYKGGCAQHKAAVQGQTKSFTITCEDDVATWSATATGSANGMSGFVYDINQANARSSKISVSGWTGNGTCWAIRKNGDCS